MDLNDRKSRILKALVDYYISTAEPVSSRTISKMDELNLSSATIRNEMADLEDMGYLEQPHTSAGRIPSYLGYRAYVDNLMRKYLVTLNEFAELRRQVNHKVEELDYYIKKVLDIASKHTNLTAIAMTPDLKKGCIKRFELMKIDAHSLHLVLITDSGLVKSKTLRLEEEITEKFVLSLRDVLNEVLAGVPLEQLGIQNVEKILQRLSGDKDLLTSIIDFVYFTVNEMNENEILLSGQNNILSLPEFKDVKKVQGFFEILDDKKEVKNIITKNIKAENLNVAIGKESRVESIEDMSLVVSTYKISDGIYGAIGVIGPMRMDYSKVVSSLEAITKNLNEGLLKDYYGNNSE
jgi:heat-inducible transcription repressor hrcA